MKTHLRNIYRKLDVSGRAEAAKKAKENFII
jgi:DNA-binding CsgD family transcriptional regulator